MGSTPLPDALKLSLEQLFELFSQYVAAARQPEKDDIRVQILGLFARLGVARKDPLVRSAAQMFERISGQALSRKVVPETPPVRARNFVNRQIRTLEKRNRITLSAGARQMLRIPVVEATEVTEHFNEGEAAASLERVFSSLMDAPLSASEGRGRTRTSIGVIRAFWKNFCNIPPICRGS